MISTVAARSWIHAGRALSEATVEIDVERVGNLRHIWFEPETNVSGSKGRISKWKGKWRYVFRQAIEYARDITEFKEEMLQ